MARHASKGVAPTMTDAERELRLSLALESSGIDKFIKDDTRLIQRYEEIKDTFSDDFPNKADSASFNFYTGAGIVREVIRDNLIQLLRFISNPKKVNESHEMCERFLQHGPEALPDRYRSLHGYRGGQLIWNEEAHVYIVMATRGWGKSFNFTAGRAVQMTLKDPFDSWLVGSYKIDPQAYELIGLIKQYMLNPNLALVYPELFSDRMDMYTARGATVTKKQINIIRFYDKEDGFDVRSIKKDPTFQPTGVKSEMTAKHVRGIFMDDLVVEETSKTDDIVSRTNSYFDRLAGLREHDAEKPFVYFLTDTHWWTPSTLNHIMETRPVKAWIAPAVWRDRKTGNFMRLSKVFTDNYLKGLRRDFGEWADSQIFMEGRARAAAVNLDLKFDKGRNVVHMDNKEFEHLWNNSLHCQVCDPAFSKKGKKEGDAKSRFTITHSLMTEHVTYLYSVEQNFGRDSAEAIQENTDAAFKHDIDMYVQDGHASQIGLVNATEKAINLCLGRDVDCFPHNNRSFSGSDDKVMLANEVCAQLFLNRSIVVLFTPKFMKGAEAIQKQLLREDPGLDIIDTIVYGELNVAKEFPREVNVQDAMRKRMVRRSRRKAREKTILYSHDNPPKKNVAGKRKRKASFVFGGNSG